MATEFTLYSIRNPDAARALAAELLRGLYARVGVEPDVDLDDLARLVIAVVEGARTQSYVEPDVLAPGRLEQQFRPRILRGLAAGTSGLPQVPGPPSDPGPTVETAR
ncbi:TetR family transcriptional regulator C-terminal domain-containing protein [Pseudonocardia sp. GCM10023141]|uniref:TetR family transcriptional regulator C-terminal domain-containing protein n=1 Tax=Pseudonocardia sp. GCM10023141 TaxID=3252653 RepID=UPI00361096FF